MYSPMARPANTVIDSLKAIQVFDYLGVSGDDDWTKMLTEQQKKDTGQRCVGPLWLF